MLLGTHFPKKSRGGKDGTTYYYSMWDSFSGVMTGKIWSPSEDTPTGRLIHLANSLVRYSHHDLTETQLSTIAKTTLLKREAAKR